MSLEFFSVMSLVLASGSGGTGWLLIGGPLAAVGTYLFLFRYYRNTDKSHQFERNTTVESKPITGGDQKVNQIRGTRQRSINGNNVSKHRKRVSRIS